MRVSVEISRPAMPARRTRRVVALAAALALLLPATALASHIFSDVATNNSAHGAIEAIYDAGVTGGCAPGKYCPNNAVTRAHMALFFERGMSRIGGLSGDIDATLEEGETLVNAMAFETGGVAGGTQFVKVDVTYSIEATALGSDCPCDVWFYVSAFDSQDGYLDGSSGTAVTVRETGWDSATVTFAFAAPSGEEITIAAWADFDYATDNPPTPTPPTIAAFADMTAVGAPFGSAGSDVLGNDTADPQGGTPRRDR